jgi:hypothetical protein
VLRIRDVYPGSWILIFTHPGSRIQKQQQKREVKKISCHTFLCSLKFHKIVNYFSFEVLKKKIWANVQRIIELFTKKIVKKLLKIWSWDPGSEIRDPEKTYSGSRIQGSKSTRSRIPDPIRNTVCRNGTIPYFLCVRRIFCCTHRVHIGVE